MFSLSSTTPASFLLFILFQLRIFLNVEASDGDQSFIFDKCIRNCIGQYCRFNNVGNIANTQPLLKLLSWSCLDECKYNCMWTTVEAFQNDGRHIPQFYGKWPFIRFAGIQEPASMVFSLLNAVSHLAIFYYRSKVPPSAHMYRVWHGMAVVGIVTWLCATVFHTRDTPLTEKMDYFSAFALMLYNVFALLCRVIGTSNRAIIATISVLLIGLYTYHVHYLAFVHFDYGYNMIMNLIVGALNGTGWIFWSAYHWKTKPYVKKCLFSVLFFNLLALLEVGDFPPLLWTLDAHAIWHGGTVPLNLLWYSFIIDDALEETTEAAVPDVKKII